MSVVDDVAWWAPIVVAAIATLVLIANPILFLTVPERVRRWLGYGSDSKDPDVLTRIATGTSVADLEGDDRAFVLIYLWTMRIMAALVVMAGVTFVTIAIVR